MKKNLCVTRRCQKNPHLRKILMTMKLMTVMFFLAISNLMATEAYSQNARLTLHLEDATVKEVLSKIEDNSEFYFLYNGKLVDVNRKVSVDATDEKISGILSDLFRETDVYWSVVDRQIVLTDKANQSSFANIGSQQQQKITGTVTDEKGNPLPGVTIRVKGIMLGALTDASGKYTIDNAPQNATLIFSFVGMATQEIPSDGRILIDVVLKEEAIGLDEVVVVGYGTQKKADLTGSVSQIKSNALEERAITTMGEAFAGQIAGVQAQQVSGKPGAELLIKMRGVSSISASSTPLYVIDGIPVVDMRDFNPNDIASVEVLKDASSAAIYGARGSNGVILITTKKGTGKPSFTFESYYGIQNADMILPMMNRDQFIAFTKYAYDLGYIRSGGSLNDPLSSRPASYRYPDSWLHPETLPDVNWQKAIYQTAPIQNYQLTASGAGDKGSYLLSGSYMNQNGIVKYSGYQRANFRLNTTLNVSDRLKLGMNIAPSFSTSNNPDDESKESVLHHAVNLSPIVSLNSNTEDWGYTPDVFSWPNPLERLKETKQETKNNKILTNVWGEVNFAKSFVFRSQYGLNYQGTRSSYFRPSNVSQGAKSTGSAQVTEFSNWSLQNTLTYSPKVSSVLDMNLLLGQSVEGTNTYNQISASVGYPNDLISTLNVASTPLTASTYESKTSLASFFGRLNFSAKDRYLLTFNIRRDGSSKFGRDTKWGLFPSISAGWKINEESFMQNLKWIDLLKLRASVGKAGNDNIGEYESISFLGIANYNLNGVLVNGLAPSTIANPDLGWETKVSKAFGLDFNAFKNRIQANFEYYIADTKDMLLNLNVPYISGYSSTRQNIGKVQNRGYEIELTSYNVKSSFEWTTTFNLSHNTNEVKQLGSGNLPIITSAFGSPVYITEVGKAINSFYMYKTNGLLLDKDFDSNGNPLVPIWAGQEKGNLKIVDLNQDGKIDEKDKTIVGSPQPKFFWGINNRFKFRNFDLSILLQGSQGAKIFFVAARHMSTGDAWGANQYAFWTRQWRPTSELALPANSNVDMSWDGKTPFGMGEKFPNFNTDIFLSDASYVRIKSITLGYNLPSAVCKRIGLANARLYIMGDNIFTFTNYIGANPETESFGNDITLPGMDYGSYPISRKYSIGINITFN